MVLQTQLLQHFFGAGFSGFAVDVRKRHRQGDVVQNGKVRDEIETLENEADFLFVECDHFFFLELADILAVHQYFTVELRIQAAQQVHQRRLAAAGFTDDRNQFTFFERQLDVLQCVETFAVGDGIIFV